MTHSSLKIIFAGTPDFSALHLRAIIDSKHQLLAVYTQPDRPAGRGKKLQASPVKRLALEQGIPVYQPPTLRSAQAQLCLQELGADLMVVVAYGLILPQAVLDTPALGCLNVHASLLPRWRGAAPIQRAIEAGDRESGITIMQMDAGLDTGDMLATQTCPISATTTAASLHDSLALLGTPLLLQVLDNLSSYQQQRCKQDDSLATYANKILKPEAEINWHLDAPLLARQIRAFNPFPICFTTLAGERVKIWQARIASTIAAPEVPGVILRADHQGILVNCGSGQLSITSLQLPGGKPLAAQEVLNSRRDQFAPGTVFSSPALSTV